MSQESQSSDLGDEYLNGMESEAVPASTKKATLYGMRKFNEWLEKSRSSSQNHYLYWHIFVVVFVMVSWVYDKI